MAALEHGAGKLTAGGTDDDPGVQEVIRRELLLLSPEVRASIEQTLTFLHPDFVEFGASGRCWDAAGVAGSMAAGDSESIEAAGFAGVRLADDVVLLTYVSRRPGRTSLRSSVWIRVGTEWLLRFHQGTVVSE